MLCVRKITFIDRAEPETVWAHNLKRQWKFGDLIAVRVHDFNERVLGSTIPMPFVAATAGEAEWGVSWIDADPVEEAAVPFAPEHESDANESSEIQSPAQPLEAGEEGGATEGAAATGPPASAAGEDGQAPPKSPMSQQGSEVAPTAPSAESAEEAAPQAPAPASEDAQAPPAAAVNKGDAAASEDGAEAPANDASVGFSATTGDEAVRKAVSEADAAAAAAAAAVVPGVAPSPSTNVAVSASATDVPPPPSHDPSTHRSGPTSSVASPVSPASQPAVRRPSFSNCIPISLAQAAKGPLFLDVITASGTKLAVTEANVQGILGADVAGEPLVQHYAIVLTPLSAKYDKTVNAVLEFSVVVGTNDGDAAIAMAASARYSPVPTSLEAGGVCAFSTRTFYYPPSFLTGTGDYIVTNVLCVESRSDNAVRLEVALPEDLKRIGVLPDKKLILNRRGERAFFTFTWNVFDAYVSLDADKDKDDEADHSAVGLHVLIRDGTENKAPVDVALIGGLPSPAEESTSPFMFYVNHARISNVACNAANEAALADILPISLVTRAGV